MFWGEALGKGIAIRIGLFWCLLILAGTYRAGGQDESSPAVQLNTPSQLAVTPTSPDREGLIHLDVAARDNIGRSLADVSAKDFTLLDEGEARKPLSFHASNDADRDERLSEVGLVIDEVDLAPEQLAIVKTETIKFLRRDGGALAHPITLFWLRNDGLYASVTHRTDGNDLAEDIAQNRLPRFLADVQIGAHLGVTLRDAMWEKVLRSIYVIAIKWRDKPGRKALIWMGFGWSVLGHLNPKGSAFPVLVELSTRIREARMVIYETTPWPDPEIPVYDKIPMIDYRTFLSGVHSTSDPTLANAVPRLALPVLAVQSGGLVLDNSQDLEGDIENCVEDASTFYSLSFDPPHAERPDEYHTLTVRFLTSQLEARTNRGYYNQPVFYDQPRSPARSLTVSELEHLLDGAFGEHDRELAQQLNSLELTERLSTGTLSHLRVRLHGKQAQAALTALADSSVFLAPPEGEVPNERAPDDAEQHQILLRTEKYLDEAIPKLPDFSADSTTIKYEQPSPGGKDTWKTALENRSLIDTVSERATLLYRNGHEQRIMDKQTGKRKATQNDLNYKGIFGPILGFIFEDVRRGNSKLIWSRWEQTEQGTLAVFRYSVRAENPRYGVVYCCLLGGRVFETLPEHHGELAIKPETGAILRLTVESQPGWIRESNLQPIRPVLSSSMMVEYGPVDIGGGSYICPRRSVVITRERTVRPVHFWDLDFAVYAPYETLMNDTEYSNYHKFGSDVRMLPGFEEVKDGKTAPASNDSLPREH